MEPGHGQGFIAVASFEDRISLSSENLPHQRAHGTVVFDDQDRFSSTLRFEGARDWRRITRAAARWKLDRERRPLADGAVHPDKSVALFDDTIGGRETQPGTL